MSQAFFMGGFVTRAQVKSKVSDRHFLQKKEGAFAPPKVPGLAERLKLVGIA